MMDKLNQDGMNAFARVLNEQMKNAAEKPLVLDFGVIQADFSLKTNTFLQPLPKDSYLVCRQLTLGSAGAWLTRTTDAVLPEEMVPAHTHSHPSVLVPESMRSIRPGDRVLVAWVGNDAVVIDIILPAAVI